MERDLARLIGAENVLPGSSGGYLADATEAQSLRGRADAVVLPTSTAAVAEVMRWCYERDVPITTRGGGTGYAGGAVPTQGGVVLATERLAVIRSFDPLLWRIHVEAGVRTKRVHDVARASGLVFPPDPGASESSTIGGNVATNAGGPHAFKHGVTGRWVTGIEAVVPPGEVVTVGGAIRKDVAGFDLKGLLVGSEGTLGIVTAAWLRLAPAPESRRPVVAFYDGVDAGCRAIEDVLGFGIEPAALEYLDSGALAAAGGFPGGVPDGAAFLVVAEAEGTAAEAARQAGELAEALGAAALDLRDMEEVRLTADLWRWREGVSFAVQAVRGGKIAEDVVVPLDQLAGIVHATVEIAARHGLPAASWGHAGDGNVHSNFLVDPSDGEQLAAAEAAIGELCDAAVALGGSVSGEHGLGWLKRDLLERQWNERALELHRSIKRAFDPKNLLNPGKKATALGPVNELVGFER
jgi:glycolate oxidase subunit GlcD